jgi:predicted Zn-dependent peptidase
MTHEFYTFPNGFRIVYQKSKNILPITYLYVFCDLGSVYENDNIRGVSHFIEHMCFKGTKKIPKSENIFKEYDKIGAIFNASTFKRYTYYNVKSHDDYFEHCVSILSDMLLHSTFNKKEYEKELKVVMEENINNTEDNEDKISDMIEKMIYEGTGYQYPIDSIEYQKKHPFKYEDVIDVYKRYYVVNNMIASIVSNIPFKKILKAIQRTFFAKEKSSCLLNTFIYNNIIPQNIIPQNIIPQNTIRYNIQKIPKSNVTYLTISFRTCNQYSLDKYKLNFLKRTLGGFFSSRLFMILREKNGLTYESNVTSQYNEIMGDFTINILTDSKKLIKNGKLPGVLPIVIKMLSELYNHGISKDELTLTKEFYKGRIALNMEDNENVVIHNGEHVLLYKDKMEFIPFENIYDVYYKNITREQVNNVIKKYIKKENMNVCILGENIPTEKTIRSICEKIST